MTPDRIRLLWAEGDAELLGLCWPAFRVWGFEVREAASGLECLRQLREFTPDVLVIDSELAWGGAEGVLAVLRENCGSCELPIVFVTGDPPPAVLSRKIDVPMAHCLQKPFSLQGLFNLIRRSPRPRGRQSIVGDGHRKER